MADPGGITPCNNGQLKATPSPFFGWQNFQTGSPPAGQYGGDELFREPFFPHFGGQTVMVVLHRHKLHLQLRRRLQDGVPNACSAIIFRSAEHADIDKMPIRGTAEFRITRQDSMPFQTRVRSADDICLVIVAKPAQKCGRGSGFPQEFVDFARAAVAQQDAIPSQLQSPLQWQGAQPATVFRTGMLIGVLIGDACEMVIAWVGITALTIGQVESQRLVVVSLDALDAVIPDQRKDTIGVRPESAKIAQAIDGVHAALPDIT